MYVFRPIPITSCSENWVIFSPVNIHSYTAPDYAPAALQLGVAYDAGQEVSRNGYDFISLKDNNTDQPYRNFVGRMPKGNDTSNDNKASWIRKGASNLFKCFMPDAAGYTESRGNFSASILPAENSFSPELVLMPKERLYLLCNGVIGSNLSISSRAYNNSIIDGSTQSVVLPDDSTEIDYVLNPELPSKARSFLYNAMSGLNSNLDWAIADSFKFDITATNSTFFSGAVSFIENALVGRLARIGISQWTNLQFSTSDRSKVVIDYWGVASLSRRRISKTVTGEIVITPDPGKTITTKIDQISKFLNYLRGSINVFVLSNKDISSTDFVLDEVAYEDVITGILKTCKIDSISGNRAIVKVSIDTVPTGYKV